MSAVMESRVPFAMQPIAGVSPPSVRETTIMTVYPSLAATSLGRTLGRLYEIKVFPYPVTLGHMIALVTSPLAAMLYFGKWAATFGAGLLKMIPGLGKAIPTPTSVHRYVLTNRRVVVRTGLTPVDDHYVELDRFDSIQVVIRPGQAWYHAGDLVFRLGQVQTFRLDGVLRPETFRRTCLEARAGYIGVRNAVGRG